jgi:hypothetical protein
MKYLCLLQFALLASLSGCTTPPPYGDLKITVYDLQGASEGAQVTLYKSLEDFNTEQNPVGESVLTGSAGQVSFFGLSAGQYFVNVVNNNLNNWEGAPEITPFITTENGFNNSKIVVIDKNKSADLSSATGKKWKILKAQLNGADITATIEACISDNQLVFYKGGKYAEDEGTSKCINTDPQTRAGTWSFNEEGTILSLTTDTATQTWGLINLNVATFRVQRNLLVEGVLLNLEVTYTPI